MRCSWNRGGRRSPTVHLCWSARESGGLGAAERLTPPPPGRQRVSRRLAVVDRIQFQPALVAGRVDALDRAAHYATGDTPGIPQDASRES